MTTPEERKLLINRLTKTTRTMLESAAGRAMSSGHYEITPEHMLAQMLTSSAQSDCAALLTYLGKTPERILNQVERNLQRIKGGNGGRPVFSDLLFTWFTEAWLLSSLQRNETAIRSGVLLAQLIRRPGRYSADDYAELEGMTEAELLKAMDDALAATYEANEATPAAGPGQTTGADGRAIPSGDSALARYASNFTETAKQGRIDPIFGRHREIRQMIDILARRRKNNPIIVGEPGVGKTALVEGLALAIAEGDVPEALKNVQLWSLDLGALQAGASAKGEFENRLKAVISEVKSSPKPIILFIDEAHQIIGAGGQKGSGDAANLLKPALARGELRTIAATTWAEFKKYFEKDAALERRFQPVKVEEPSEADATVMLRGLRHAYEKSHGVIIRDEAVKAAVVLSNRYISGRQLPDKAVDLLDTTAARVRVERGAKPEALADLDNSVAALVREKTALERDIKDGNPELTERLKACEEEMAGTKDKAETLRGRWNAQREALDALIDARAKLAVAKGETTTEAASEKGGAKPADAKKEPPKAEVPAGPPPDLATLEKAVRDAQAKFDELAGEDPLVHADLDEDAVAQTVAAWTGIPIGKMKRDNVQTVLELDQRMRERVIGQDHAIQTVGEALRIAHAEIRNPESPIAVMLFVGPSGVGKTETALALADMLYGGERFLITVNMSEFQEKHTVSRLIGSPPGYVGYGEGGMLTEAVRQRPYSVVLLDEVEKAHLDVMNLVYQVFDKGQLSDGEGREINFKNTVVILTSNLATNELMQIYGSGENRPNPEEVVGKIRPVLSAHFKPALLARMTIIPYAPIDPKSMRTIVGLKMGKILKRLKEAHGITTTLTDEMIDEVARRCTEAETGARNVDHILRGTLMPLIARELLETLASNAEPSALEIAIGPDGDFRLNFS
jgi:type VI secretion system protein VasG